MLDVAGVRSGTPPYFGFDGHGLEMFKGVDSGENKVLMIYLERLDHKIQKQVMYTFNLILLNSCILFHGY